MTTASRAVAAVAMATVLSLVGACGAEDPYCVEVEAAQPTLDEFGSERSDEAFATYAAVLTSISELAPTPVDEQWASLARATQGVITTHEDIGFALEDMDDEDERAALSEGDIDVLNKAYDRFNNTTGQREKVVADVKQTCDIQLK